MEKKSDYLQRFSLQWLITGLIALAISGLFSIVVAVAWHPSVKSVEIFATLFRRSLISHVNLSITVWFLCFLFLFWSYDEKHSSIKLPFFNRFAQFLMLSSVALMTYATFDHDAIPHLNNYIPTLQHPVFYLSLGCIAAATIIKWVEYGLCSLKAPIHDFVTLANRLSHIMIAFALSAFIVSGASIESFIDGEMYYEILFWGGGHVLQFIWVQLLMIAWVLLLKELVEGFSLHQAYRFILWVNMAAVLTTPIPYIMHDVSSGDFRQMFTLLMAWVSGAAPVLFLLLFIIQAFQKQHRLLFRYFHPYGASLWWSLILFGTGGFFAVMIDGINVKIPAHYHGSLLGVTVALMGMSYLLLEKHGYYYIRTSRLAVWQASLLGIGQMMHIGGLFWSGGYGVQRKSPDMAGEVMEKADLALRIQSSGGGLAILGGLLFLIVCIKAWKKGKSPLD